ncbi:hypothetical protein Ahy_A08g037994 [Arachis hypogaea]|uniref:Uncharacterized protein n=1 Tax=Arachis hypogaea TaxID=3818 RepID=A0A445BSI4_ARAHY|nr:hypothetical protein Ahy_A08g037994 [Arachis hypogaea]
MPTPAFTFYSTMSASASFLAPSPSFAPFRGCKEVPRMFSVSNKKENRTSKLYIIPITTVTRFCASTASLESLHFADTNANQNHRINEFENELNEFFDEVKTMIRMGKRDDALDLLNAGSKGIQEAAILDVLALGYVAVGDLETVASLLNVMRKVIDNLKDDTQHLDLILTHMGSMYSTLSKFGKSLDTYQRAFNIMERTYGNDSPFLVTPYLAMAKVLGSTGKATKAIEKYQCAITILESKRGAESKDLVVPLLGLGNLLLKERRVNDAETHFTRVLDIYTKSYGQNDGRIGLAMSSLAQVKCAQGKSDEAINLYEHALHVMKDSNYLSPDDSIMEKMRVDLAELLHAVGRQRIIRGMLINHREAQRKRSPRLSDTHDKSCNFIFPIEELCRGRALVEKSLEIMIKQKGSDDQFVSFPMLQLAVTLHHLKQDEEAEKLALDALRIREKAFGEDSLPVGEALDCLVSIQTQVGKDESELVVLLRRILGIQEREFGYESEEVLVTVKKIVFLLDKLGRRDEMLPLQRRLSLLRKKYKQMIHH